MDSQKPRIVVAHPGKQHSYRLAVALKQANMLFKYVTTVYDSDRSFLMRFVKSFLNNDNLNRAERRRCPDLHDDDVVQFCELGALIHLLLIRLDRTHILSNWYGRVVSRRFQKRLARFLIQRNVDIIISYDTNSSVLFSILKKKAPQIIRVMDNAHPNRHFLFIDYHKNWECCGAFVDTLKACRYLTNERVASYYKDEAQKAQYHIVASSYSERGLKETGISADSIFRIPYGVDSGKFIKSDRVYQKGSINVLFLGEINQRKGICQVLESAKYLYNKGVHFNIVGGGKNHCAYLYEPYNNYANFTGYVSYPELLRQLEINHVLVFPTMGEGFGLVILECMAAGLPVISTFNCGGADVIDDGVNGFLVPVGNTSAIIDRLIWLRDHPQKLKQMSLAAIETAREFTWDKYNKGIIDCMENIISTRNLG